MLLSVRRYMSFFLLMSAVTTCCMLLFLNQLTEVTGLTLTQENLSGAAKMTFYNVVFLSFLCTVIDSVRRRYMVNRPVKRIADAAEKIMHGDLSVRVAPLGGVYAMDSFDVIIDYFNRMAQELSGIETLRTDFIANVSHELKTPLAVMGNYGVMLQSPDLSQEKRVEYARAVTAASRRLGDLISNILKLNKLENQQIFPEVQDYNLSEQLCQCLLTFESTWEEKQLEIETDIPEDVFLRGDPELLSLVWNNLLSNAMKFTKHGGRVSVCLAPAGSRVSVSVADTGPGMDAAVGARIFEKFYQGDDSHAGQGNGLGLALVKRVMDIVGGDISVESCLGQGSTFTVTLENLERSVQNHG